MPRSSHHATILLWLLVAGVGSVVAQTATWLDRPLTSWNKPAAPLPSPARKAAAAAAVAKRCSLAASTAVSAATAVTAAGWIPYLHQDRTLAREGVEVIAGLSDANAACEAAGFNLFVFIDGRFAGTLSPVPMTTGRDGAAGAVRIVNADSLTAEFARFVPGDLECCPSTRLRVTYRIDRGEQPTVIATGMQVLR